MGKHTHWNTIILVGGITQPSGFFDPEQYAKQVQTVCSRTSYRLISLALLEATLPNGMCVGPVKVCEEMTGYSRPTITAALRHIAKEGLIVNEKALKEGQEQQKHREHRSR